MQTISSSLSLPHQKNQRDELIYCELLWRLRLGSRAWLHVPSSIIHLASCAATHARKILIQEAPVICCHNHVSRCDSWATPLSGQAPYARANSLGLLLLLLLLPPHNQSWREDRCGLILVITHQSLESKRRFLLSQITHTISTSISKHKLFHPDYLNVSTMTLVSTLSIIHWGYWVLQPCCLKIFEYVPWENRI